MGRAAPLVWLALALLGVTLANARVVSNGFVYEPQGFVRVCDGAFVDATGTQLNIAGFNRSAAASAPASACARLTRTLLLGLKPCLAPRARAHASGARTRRARSRGPRLPGLALLRPACV